MKQLTFQDIAEFANWLEAVAEQFPDDTDEPSEPQMDTETPTNVEIPEMMTPIEALISQFINNHITAGTFPSFEEAKTIEVLDAINAKYN